MLWVTRHFVHVDRVACPWLIKRFVDPKAQFIFLPREEIPEFVEKTGAIPFDTGTGVELDHFERDGVKYCTFDKIIEKYNLTENKALAALREVVRAADTGRENEVPLAFALEAIASGAPLLVESDHDALELEFPFYDSLLAFFKRDLVMDKYFEKIRDMKSRKEKREFIKEKLREV